MSYSANLKATLSLTEVVDDGIKVAELYGFLHSAGTISLSAGTIKLILLCDSAAVSRRYFAIIKDIFGLTPLLGVKKGTAFSRGNRYMLQFTTSEEAMELLSFYNIYDLFENRLNDEIDLSFINTVETRQAYQRGIFLGCGHMSDPTKTYHLTMNIGNLVRAEQIRALLEHDDIAMKVSKRQEHISLSLKDRDGIATFLAYIGAHKAMLDFESLLTVKDFRNDTVRIINSETANIDKTANTAARQIEAIQCVLEAAGPQALNAKLTEAARLRMAYPELPLSALCKLFKPPIGKSAAYKRYLQIEKIAADIS